MMLHSLYTAWIYSPEGAQWDLSSSPCCTEEAMRSGENDAYKKDMLSSTLVCTKAQYRLAVVRNTHSVWIS